MRDLWRFIGFGHGWPLGVALLLGCLLLGADVSQGGADICGCASNPNNLGDFDTANPASYPPGTVSAANGFGGNNITIPLSADGVLIFKSFTGTRLPNTPGCCTFDTFILFKRNAANSPATILVSGDARLDAGVFLMVNGDDGTGGSGGINGLGGLGGPGGFRGGDAAYQLVNLAADGGAGFGPGGGAPGTGSPALSKGTNATFVGVPEVLPLVGGSGGGGGGSSSNAQNCSGGGGGGGGGGLLLAANGTITINGRMASEGGASGDTPNGACASGGGTGSGGAIRPEDFFMNREADQVGFYISTIIRDDSFIVFIHGEVTRIYLPGHIPIGIVFELHLRMLVSEVTFGLSQKWKINAGKWGGQIVGIDSFR